jgi:RimJ/RimL family protein N-acetyltransferase
MTILTQPAHAMARIAVDQFCAADIDGFLHYWYASGPDALLRMGVDPARLPRPNKMREMLEWNLARDAASGQPQNAILSIKLDGETVGVHELTHLVARGAAPGYASAIMHAHIWRAEHRGQGIARVSYVLAMECFFARFGLDTIRFESPRDNPGAIGIKQKLGLRACGTGTIDLPILARPLPTVCYEVTRAELAGLGARMRHATPENVPA